MAVLPLGATEPHNLHLPYGTDTFQVQIVAERAAARAHEGGARVVVLPTLPYGTETNQMQFPLAMNLNPSTVARVITDLVDSLAAHSIRKCVLLNGHGGNDLKWVLRELHLATPVHLFLCHWYKIAGATRGRPLRGSRRSRRGDGDEHGAGPLPRPRRDGPGRRRDHGPHPVRRPSIRAGSRSPARGTS